MSRNKVHCHRLVETDLYPSVKAHLERLGYEVKSEVVGCDVVAERPGDPLLIVELKTAFTLDLLVQGVDRQGLTESVYLAVPAPDTAAKRKNWRAKEKGCLTLCRKLGLGLMLVAPEAPAGAQVAVQLDPAPYRPRKNPKRLARLKKEFDARAGDPNVGGMTGKTIVTAYRQDALRIAATLMSVDEAGLGTTDIKQRSGVDRASGILQKNHYLWFERVSRGVYRLTSAGRAAVEAVATDA